MPGRKSTAVLPVKKRKAKKQTQKRSLDALAIAEEQNQERVKIRKNRLGATEPESVQLKRKIPREDSDEEDIGNEAKRRRAGAKDRFGNKVEIGSDSDGNQWTLGQVESENDSDLDSEEAFGESDEDRFEGFTFRGADTTNSAESGMRRTTDVLIHGDEPIVIDLNEKSDDFGTLAEESDDFGEEAVDLAAMLDASDEEVNARPRSNTSKRLEEIPGAEDDENPTDTESSIDDRNSALSYSEDDEDATFSMKLSKLQAFVSSINAQDQASSNHQKSVNYAHESITPSEFGINSRQKLTVTDLLPSVTDPRLKKSLKLLASNDSKTSGKRNGIPKKLDVPLAKRQQDRLDRTAAYEKSKETLNRWIDTVKYNRRAEHLFFPLQDKNSVAAQGSERLLPATQSQAMNDLENVIQNILKDSGLAPVDGKSEEEQLQAFEELQTNRMPLEEVQARRAELRKARELLFREEIRAKRIKKIKSKSYRRIHRRERDKNLQQEKEGFKDAGLLDSEEEQECNDRRRAEERMGARHREGKWARSVKDSGRAAWDEDARTGVTEMARRGEELKRRIEGKEDVIADDGSIMSRSESSEGEDDEGEEKDRRGIMKLESRLQRLHDRENSISGARGARSGLSSMKFMINAEAAQKDRNDADVERLRKEIAGEDSASEPESIQGPGRRSYGPSSNITSTTQRFPTEQRDEFEERQTSVDDDEITLRTDAEMIPDTAVAKVNRFVTKTSPANPLRSRKNRPLVHELALESVDNPWLSNNNKKSSKSKKLPLDSRAPAIISNFVATDPIEVRGSKRTPRSALKGSREGEKAQENIQLLETQAALSDPDSDQGDEEPSKQPFVLRNQELIRKAFAGDEVVTDFENEKRETIHAEDEKVVDNTLPGWGNWTGAGLSKKEQKRNKGRFMTKVEGIKEDKRQDAKLDRVIINEKRVKKVCHSC